MTSHYQTLSDSYSSQKSSGIHSEGLASESHKRSICGEEIISENYKEQFQDDELYNEESSLPLCMKEYYIHEKEMNQKESQQNMSAQNQFLEQYSPNEHSQNQQVQLISYQQPFLDKQSTHYQSTVQERNKILSSQLQSQKIKNLHFQKMLSILIDEDNLQRQKLQNLSEFYQQKYQRFCEIEQQNRRLKLRNQELEKQVEHYKGLIYIANNNYELVLSKLEETKNKLLLLEIDKESREKDFHQKLQNLKQVMKSLMTNLKKTQNHTSLQPYQTNRFQFKEGPNNQCLYSFGDQDVNLRERKQKNKNQKQQVFNSVQNKGNSTKNINSQRTLTVKQSFKKNQQKQNFETPQKTEQFSDHNKNFASHKATFTKIKSPKNLTVEQNYRKLFMKTLVTSSSQKPKNM